MDLRYTLAPHRPRQVGMVVLQSDESIEPDLRRLLPAELELLVSRVPSDLQVTSDTLAAMAPRLTAAAHLLPAGARFSVVGYGCTSGTAEIGVDTIHQLVKAGIDTPAVTEPVSALLAACRHLGVRKLATISPYIPSVSGTLHAVLEANGISITGFASFNEPEEAAVVRIAPDSIVEAAVQLAAQTDCDAVFLSCTNLRALDAIGRAEQRIGKPVLSSNQVLGWHLCNLAGVAPSGAAPGQLFGPVARALA